MEDFKAHHSYWTNYTAVIIIAMDELKGTQICPDFLQNIFLFVYATDKDHLNHFLLISILV